MLSLLDASSPTRDFIDLRTSSLETGPTVIWETGTLDYSRKAKSASNDPRVEAATPTPRSTNLIFDFTF